MPLSHSPLNRRQLIGAALAAGAIVPIGAARAQANADAIVELRQYTLRGGRRDDLIALFDREFIAPQNALGAHVIGQFRDLDDPDRFVWLRGFADMATRFDALTRFYDGPVWQAHRNAANPTMRDSDNVLLLRNLGGPLPQGGETQLVRIAIHYLGAVDPGAFLAFFRAAMALRIERAGGRVEALLASAGLPNNFPRLPVREGEAVFVWLSRFADEAAEAAFSRRLAGESGWRDDAPDALLPALMRKPEILRLAPTAGSALR